MSYMLRMLRREDRRRMVDRCDITRGTYPDHVRVASEVPCVVRPARGGGRSEIVQGGEAVTLHFYDVRLPYDQDVRRGDVLTVTRSDDPQMVDRAVTVRESTIDSEQTSRLVVAEESR